MSICRSRCISAKRFEWPASPSCDMFPHLELLEDFHNVFNVAPTSIHDLPRPPAASSSDDSSQYSTQTSSTDDLSRLVASSKFIDAIPPQSESKANLTTNAVGRVSCLTPAEPLLSGSHVLTKNACSISSWSISFGTSQSPFNAEGKTITPWTSSSAHKRKRYFGRTHEQLYTELEQLNLHHLDDVYFLHAVTSDETTRIPTPIRSLQVCDLSCKRDSEASAAAPSKVQSHVLAERRRRTKFNQRFIELSTVLPGLAKMDKASILSETIKYVKELQRQLKQLEDSNATTSEAATSCMRDQFNHTMNSDNDTRLVEKSRGFGQPAVIKARAAGRCVLIHIHCDNIKGILMKAVEMMEQMPLSISSVNVTSFSNIALELTFTAQVEEDNEVTTNDIVQALHNCFQHK